MALLKKEKCPICGRESRSIGLYLKAEGTTACSECTDKIWSIYKPAKKAANMSAEELRKVLGIKTVAKEEEVNQFQITKQIGMLFYYDEINEKFALPFLSINKKKSQGYRIYDCSDIVDFKLYDDGEEFGFGSIGGPLMPSWGLMTATLKSCTTMQIRIFLKDIETPVANIDIITKPTSRKSKAFKEAEMLAQEIIAILTNLSEKNKKEDAVKETVATSGAEEILKYKELLDLGIIDEEEFKFKKQQIIGMPSNGESTLKSKDELLEVWICKECGTENNYNFCKKCGNQRMV